MGKGKLQAAAEKLAAMGATVSVEHGVPPIHIPAGEREAMGKLAGIDRRFDAQTGVKPGARLGHNSEINPSTAGQLKSIIERIENLEEEKRQIGADIKDVYGEAKVNGFDTKTIRKIVALRRIDASERHEQAALLETYLRALGME